MELRKKINHRDTEEREVARRGRISFLREQKRECPAARRGKSKDAPQFAAFRGNGFSLFALAKRELFPLCYLLYLCASVVNFFFFPLISSARKKHDADCLTDQLEVQPKGAVFNINLLELDSLL